MLQSAPQSSPESSSGYFGDTLITLRNDVNGVVSPKSPGRKMDSLLSDRQGLLSGIENWSDSLKADDEAERVSRLKLYTRTGRPLGSETFTRQVELKTGRELRPKPHGRPSRRRS
jgi:hypothetical protein